MNDVFDITEGLDITEPLENKGHSPVYKGRRTGTVISAVKLLPVPVFPLTNGSDTSKYTHDELLRLKKLGEHPHPNVAGILNTGISNTGKFPFIEMEFINGPDLEQLLRSPGDPVFSIRETLRVAEQLSNALAHCHRLEIKHGNIKCSSVRRNLRTGNYTLVDFGFTAMLEEQRRSSLRHADNPESFAPEQLNGQVLYQTDVYNFGLVLFKILTGRFPPDLKTASPVQELPGLRSAAIPASWSEEKKAGEKAVPGWLLAVIVKCLEKNPVQRFANGFELHDHIVQMAQSGAQQAGSFPDTSELQVENRKLLKENTEMKQIVEKAQFFDKITYQQLKDLNETILLKDKELEQVKLQLGRGALSMPAVAGLLVVAVLLGALASYFLLPGKPAGGASSGQVILSAAPDTLANEQQAPVVQQKATVPKPFKKLQADTAVNPEKDLLRQRPSEPQATKDDPVTAGRKENASAEGTPATEEPAGGTNGALGPYKVRSKAYFYNQPDEHTRREAFIIHWNNAILYPVDEQGDFVYIVFTNHLGQKSKGWLHKKDLIRVAE